MTHVTADRSRPDAGAPRSSLVAYFTMEAALADALPTYSGGLGVLAGDFLRAAADLGLPVVAVTLCYRGGYFRQHLDAAGRQAEAPVSWNPDEMLELLPTTVEVEVSGRPVRVAAWRYVLHGVSGGQVPVYLLDTALPQNDDEARSITARLYGGNERYRLEQETVLGIGGVEMLAALGVGRPGTFHMNEGHSSLLTLRLLEEQLFARGAEHDEPRPEDLVAVRRRCAFTTHTPVPAGHDRFEAALCAEVLGERRTKMLDRIGQLRNSTLNMTELGMGLSHYVNAVSLRHREVTRSMFPGVEVSSITNGVHAATWCSPGIAALLDEHLAGWRVRNDLLRYATGLPLTELAEAHQAAKSILLAEVRERTGRALDPAVLTIGIGRRATPYKQTTLIFSDPERLAAVASEVGPVQVVCSGKAHPRDEAGKELITSIFDAARKLRGKVEVVYLEDYDLATARLMVSGTDIWLNTPHKPYEASGTSGMKAAMNGVPSLSTLDGWWIEGWIEGVTGWAIGTMAEGADDAEDLYTKLEEVVVPLFYDSPDSFTVVRRNAIAYNGSFFNTERMAAEYARDAYGLGAGAWRTGAPNPPAEVHGA
jgi:starch phosphorylase